MSEHAQLPGHPGPRRLLAAAVLLLLTTACGPTPAPLTEHDSALLERPASQYGTLVYTGEVTPHGEGKPAFRYQRWVETEGETMRSTHVTMPTDTSRPPVLFQQATHGRDYRLTHYDEISGQLGVTCSIQIATDGTATFTVRRGPKTQTSVEPAGAPLVVGPTLFGFVRTHLPELHDGRTMDVRFAVADQARSYPFVLRATTSSRGRTTVTMEGGELLVRMSVDAMRIELDEVGTITSYHGRVPPLLAGNAFDADVQYTYSVPFQ